MKFAVALIPCLAILHASGFEKQIELPADSASFASGILISRTQEHIRRLMPTEKRDGKFIFRWDGLDDNGKTAGPGEYTFCATTHQGFKTRYNSTPYMPNPDPFYGNGRGGGWLSDLSGAAAIEHLDGALWVGAPFAAGGDSIMQIASSGKKLHGYPGPEKSGAWYLREQGGQIYALAAGGWLGTNLQVSVFDPMKKEFAVLFKTPLPEPQEHTSWLTRPGNGFAVDSERIFISHTRHNRIDVYRKDGKQEKILGVKAPGAMRFHNGKLYLISGSHLVEFNLQTGNSKPLITDSLQKPMDFIFLKDEIYVADAGARRVQVFSGKGKFLRSIGKGEPRKAGKFDPRILDAPISIAVGSSGKLWICESGEMPKRISVWSTDGKFICDYNGAGRFHSGGWLDPHDINYFFAEGMRFKRVRGIWNLDSIYLDLSRNFALLFEKNASRPERPAVYNGRTHLIADRLHNNSRIIWFGRMERDFVLKPYAAVGCYSAIMPLFQERPANFSGKPNAYTFLWVNRNNDSNMSWDELQFDKDPFIPLQWSAQMDRDLNFYWIGGTGIRKLSPKTGPLPDYDLSTARTIRKIAKGERLNGIAPVGGDRLFVNRNPLTCISQTTGHILWTSPLKDMLNCAGYVAVPDYGFVFLLTGSKESVLFSNDGHYLGPLETGKKKTLPGCTLERGSDGKIYLCGGEGAHSIYEIEGFEHLKRRSIKVVFPEHEQKSAEETRIGKIRASRPDNSPYILPQMKNGTWNGIEEQFCSRNGKQLYAYRLGIDGTNLRGEFKIFDPTPLVNNGKDWRRLFKSGDSVSLEFAAANTGDPQPGDIRILFAPFRGNPVAVAYRYKIPGADPKTAVEFVSATGTTVVSKVELLNNVKLRGEKRDGGYCLEFSVPLSELPPLSNDVFYYDADVTFSDASGEKAAFSFYHHSPVKNTMDDIAKELRLMPSYLKKAVKK